MPPTPEKHNRGEDEKRAYNRRMSSQFLSAILLVTMFGRDDTQPQRTPISVVLACEDSQRMTVTIRNGGTADTAVIFGVVLANGSKYLVDDMTMQVTTGSGRLVEQSGTIRDIIQPVLLVARTTGSSHFRLVHRIRLPSQRRISSLVPT